MRIIKTKDYDDMSKKAAQIIRAQSIMEPESVIGLATGSSPIGIYKDLAKWYEEGELDFSDIKAVNLDEYKGLSKDDSQSYAYFMKEKLFSKINIKAENTYIPNGLAENDDEECKRYDEIIQELGGVDLQLLGLGHNGHIAFNEPGDCFEKDTNMVGLTKSTIEANARMFDDPEDVPKTAYTMGIRSIFMADKIVMVVSGADKAPMVKEAFFGPITPQVPASILQMHKNFTLVADEAALSKI